MKRLVVLAVLAALVAVAASTAFGRNARPNAPAACAKGAVAARIGGKACACTPGWPARPSTTASTRGTGSPVSRGICARHRSRSHLRPRLPPTPSVLAADRDGGYGQHDGHRRTVRLDQWLRLHRSLSDDDPVGHGHVRDHEQLHLGPAASTSRASRRARYSTPGPVRNVDGRAGPGHLPLSLRR